MSKQKQIHALSLALLLTLLLFTACANNSSRLTRKDFNFYVDGRAAFDIREKKMQTPE